MKIDIRQNQIVLFLIIFLVLFIAFIFYLGIKKQEGKINTINRYKHMISHIKEKNMTRSSLDEYLNSILLKPPLDPRRVLLSGTVVYAHHDFKFLQYKNNNFLLINIPKYKNLYKDPYRNYNFLYIYIIFFSIFIFSIVTYLWLINSLGLIYKAKQSINYLTSDKQNKTKEYFAQDDGFGKEIKKIELLIQSKQLFLRTIMHELNTPIAKGRIVSELISDKKQRLRVGNIFDRLDFLLNDFLKLEQMLSNKHDLIRQKYSMEEIIDEALHAMMARDIERKISIDIKEDTILQIDLALMSIVFKNLIDNALKYSYDKKIKINQYKNRLIFISKGHKLLKSIQHYFEPYHNNQHLKRQGKGLGLYIIKSILDIHDFSLSYRYIHGFNIFCINLEA